MADAQATREAILEPSLPIIDPHHHLWDHSRHAADQPPMPEWLVQRYLPDELLADLSLGHNVRATVFVECAAMYRADGPVPMRPVGEIEFVNGVAAMFASGTYGELRACAGIVGNADLTLGARVDEVLEAMVAAGGGRFRGVRNIAGFDEDAGVLGVGASAPPGFYLSAAFREGFARLKPLGLSFDAWLLEPQLNDLLDLAHAFPETSIVLDHMGTPLGVGVYAGRLNERFGTWRDKIRSLGACENVAVKMGGLAMPWLGFPSFKERPAVASAQLADEWRPYIETCIEAFGADRCMFESNFPVDGYGCPYDLLWNAFKVITAGYSAPEKTALYSGAAAQFYRLDL